MAQHDDDLLDIEAESAAIAEDAMGAAAGSLAQTLAGRSAAAMGDSVAEKYARIGANLLSDAMPSRLDQDMIDRLASAGFDRDKLRTIRVHRGLKASAAADALSARAFAVGDSDIFFGRGEYDPASPTGRAVIAHEVAHVAPPGGVSSFGGGAPVLNERKHGDEDAAGEEAHEQQAREAEAFIYAQEDASSGGGPAQTSMEAPAQVEAAVSSAPEVNVYALENKVMAILSKIERSEVERRGRFIER
jgi:hypothetical protein